MGEVVEIKQKVFLGTIPVKVNFYDLDLPLYMNVPRCISFASFFHKKFEFEINGSCNDFYMMSGGRHIQPNLPAGFIYDSFYPPNSQFSVLEIFIKKGNFPSTGVLRCPSQEVADKFFNHAFKNALFLQNDNTVLFQQYSKLPENILEAVKSQNFEKFAEQQKIVENNSKTWNKWPIKALSSEGKVTNHFAVPKDGQTLKDILNVDTVTIHGIEVDANTLVTNVIPLLLYPDGFLYVTF